MAMATSLAATTALLPAAARAGAWAEPAGQWFMINSFSYYQVGLSGYNALGQPSGHGTYRQGEFSPYLEYGVTNRFTVGEQARLQIVSQSGLPGTKTSFGMVQLNLFARYVLFANNNNVFSLQGTVGIPGAATTNEPGLAQPGAEYEARALYGHNFTLPDGWTGFTDAEAGYRFEEDGWANQFRGDFTLGIAPDPQWLVLAQSFNTVSTGSAAPRGSDYDLYRIEVSAVRALTPHISLQLGAWHDVAGRQIALGDAGIAALWLRY